MTVNQGASGLAPFPIHAPVDHRLDSSPDWRPTRMGGGQGRLYVYRAIVIGVTTLLALLLLLAVWKKIKGAREKAQKRLERAVRSP